MRIHLSQSNSCGDVSILKGQYSWIASKYIIHISQNIDCVFRVVGFIAQTGKISGSHGTEDTVFLGQKGRGEKIFSGGLSLTPRKYFFTTPFLPQENALF